MLIKKVCKQCCNHTMLKWDKEDEMRWKNDGQVLCPFTQDDTEEGPKSIKRIPKKCPYALEQTVCSKT